MTGNSLNQQIWLSGKANSAFCIELEEIIGICPVTLKGIGQFFYLAIDGPHLVLPQENNIVWEFSLSLQICLYPNPSF